MIILTPSWKRTKQKVRGIHRWHWSISNWRKLGNVVCSSIWGVNVLSILHRVMGIRNEDREQIDRSQRMPSISISLRHGFLTKLVFIKARTLEWTEWRTYGKHVVGTKYVRTSEWYVWLVLPMISLRVEMRTDEDASLEDTTVPACMVFTNRNA